jgi:hypothetical protein
MTSRKKKQWPQRGHFQRRATAVTAIQSAAYPKNAEMITLSRRMSEGNR